MLTKIDGGADYDEDFVDFGVLDEEAHKDGGYGRGEGECLGDVAGGDYAGALHDLEVGVEVGKDGGIKGS